MAEAAVCHVELHLSEDGFGLYASSSAVFESGFRRQQFSGFTLVPVQAVVDLDYTPVSFGLVAFCFRPIRSIRIQFVSKNIRVIRVSRQFYTKEHRFVRGR